MLGARVLSNAVGAAMHTHVHSLVAHTVRRFKASIAMILAVTGLKRNNNSLTSVKLSQQLKLAENLNRAIKTCCQSMIP